MAHAHGPLQQQQVLWEGTLEHQQYGELTAEATFAQPVLVTGIRGTAGSLEGFLQLLPQLVKGFAKDLHIPTAARFGLLFNAVSVTQQETQEWRVDEVFPTQHVWLRARCRSIKVQLLGYALDEAPQHIWAAAEARFCPLPEASPLLSLPSAQQDSQLPQAPSGPAAAPSLPRPPGKQLPLGKIPPAFVLTLAPLAKYWQDVRRIPLPPGSPKPSNADLLACQEMADAVLAAQRGSPAGLKGKLANTRNVRGIAVDWDGIRDSVLDMATYCCSALGDNLVDPIDLSMASAGVCAAIMLAACQDGAAQFLAWPNRGVGVAGAIAVRDLVSTPDQPGQWQAWSMGLVDLLLESCPAVAGPTLQGTLNPAAIPEPQGLDDSGAEGEADAGTDVAADAHGSRDGEHMLADAQEEDRPDKTHSMSADGASEPAASVDGEDAVAAGQDLPAAKRQRVSEHAAAPADAAAHGGMSVGAGTGLMNAESTTGSAAAAALAAAATDGAEVPGQQPLPLLQQQLSVQGGGSDDGDDDALLAGLHQDSDNPDSVQTGAAARTKRQKLQQAADGIHRGQGLQHDGEDDRSEGWDPDELDNRGSEEAAGGAGQQDGSKDGAKRQQEALEEGDYPEADEEAIRLEAAAKAARRGVERRPPVCALARGQLYTAIMQLAMSPLQHNAAISCQSVLRRLRAYQCLDALQAAVGPLLSGRVDPMQLELQELCTLINQAAAAANDLAALVLQPLPSNRSLFLYPQEGQAGGGSLLREQPQEADQCVLQLLLSFRGLELLGALNCCIGVHMSRLAQQQQSDSCLKQQGAQEAGSKQLQASHHHQQQQQQQQQGLELRAQQQPQQPTEPPDEHLQDQASSAQQSQLCCEHAQLLDSIRALTSALTASSGGWCFLTAARDGLAALAAAVCPTRQVCLDGGPFSPDTSAPYDPQHGWEAERQALTAAASGLGSAATDAGAPALHGASSDTSAAAAAAAAGDLSDSLQRLWLLVEATTQLQGAEDMLSGKNRAPGAVDKLNAAMKTLFVGGFASELGQQSLVSALSACSPAVHQLGVLLKHCSEVHAAAAAGQPDQGPGSQQLQDRALNLSLGLRLGYGALYAPEILLAFMMSPHIDAIATWLPLTGTLHEAIREHLYQHEVSASAAAKAAFPDILSANAAALQECGLPTAILPGGAATAKDRSELVLLQLHGAALTAHNLVQLWQGRAPDAPLGASSAGKMLDWLHAQLPKLESVVSKPPAVVDPEGVAPKLPKTASSAFVAVQASDATSQLDGAAAAGGAPPPAGKDVKSDAVVEFMRNAACRSAALCALHLIDMLLRGSPDSVRTMARKAHKQPRGASRTAPAFVPSIALPEGPARQGVMGDGSSSTQDDGFAVREVVRELLEGVAVRAQPIKEPVQVEVFELLERALRTATVALRGSDADLVWSTRGGNQQNILSVLQSRTAAAALMRAACTTTASLLLHLSDADPRHRAQSYAIQKDGLMDALICAHSAVVSCHEGLQACVPHPQLTPCISRATDPGLNPVQRAAADAAVASASVRVCGGRVLLLLEARQALSVCLRCWQLQGWWPDPVGALMGAFPRASAAADEFAREDAAAQKEGDPSAPPSAPPRQGPRQLLSSLLGLADLCPEEWPHRGASKAVAKQRDADAHTTFGGTGPAHAFERPSLILLRQAVANALEVHWDRLERLIDFGLSCSTRMARLAVVRMLTRMAGLGAGMAPLLGPKVLLALCSRLHTIQQLRKGLGNRLHAIKALTAPEGDKQRLIDQEIDTLHLQLRGAAQVCEVLLPLCGAPSIKSVLTEHKAAGVLGKAVYALVKPLADLQQLAADEGAAAAGAVTGGNGGNGSGSAAPAAGLGLERLASEGQFVVGLLLQLVGALMDPDISMNPWADRSARQLHDSPSIFTSSITAAWLLAAAPNLNPANMAAVAQLLVGSSTAAAIDAAPTARGAPVTTDTAGQQATAAAAAASAEQPAVLGGRQSNGQPAGGAVCLKSSAKGRAALLQLGHHWRLLDECLRGAQEREAQSHPGSALAGGAAATAAPRPAKQETGSGMTQAELQASAEWAAAALESTQCVGGTDATHAASCAAIAQVLRELGGSSGGCAAAWQEYEVVVQAEQEVKPQLTWAKFIMAAKSAAAAHQPGGPDQQSLATLLSSPPLLLACDAACLDFWTTSAASVQHAAVCPLPAVWYPHNAAQPTASACSWWPRPQLVAGSNPRPRSQAIEDLLRLGEEEDRKRRDKADAGRPGGVGDDGDDDPGGGFVPAVYAQRGPQFLKDDQSSRKTSMYVDDYQRLAAERAQKQKQRQNMPPPAPRPPGTGGPAPGACYQCGREGHIAMDCPLGPPKCFSCGQQGHLARDCPRPDICHRCGEAGHLVSHCKAPAGVRRGVPPGMRPGPPRDGPGLPPPPPPSGGPRGPGGRQLPPVQQKSPPHQLSPRDGSGGGGVMGPPADPRLRRQPQQQGTGGGASVSPSPGRSPLSPGGGSGTLPTAASGGFGALSSGVLPPGLGPAATPPAVAAVLAGGVAVTPGGVATAPAAAGAAGCVRSSSYDEDAALLQGLDDGSQEGLQGGDGDGVDDVDEGAGIGDFLDGLIGGADADEDMGGDEDEGNYGVSEAGGL